MDFNSHKEIEMLASRALKLAKFSLTNLERCCWMVLHENRHGVMPSEYDIREIDEELYTQVLAIAKSKI